MAYEAGCHVAKRIAGVFAERKGDRKGIKLVMDRAVWNLFHLRSNHLSRRSKYCSCRPRPAQVDGAVLIEGSVGSFLLRRRGHRSVARCGGLFQASQHRFPDRSGPWLERCPALPAIEIAGALPNDNATHGDHFCLCITAGPYGANEEHRMASLTYSGTMVYTQACSLLYVNRYRDANSTFHGWSLTRRSIS